MPFGSVPVAPTLTGLPFPKNVCADPNAAAPKKLMEPPKQLVLPVVTETVFDPVGNPPILPQREIPPAVLLSEGMEPSLLRATPP